MSRFPHKRPVARSNGEVVPMLVGKPDRCAMSLGRPGSGIGVTGRECDLQIHGYQEADRA